MNTTKITASVVAVLAAGVIGYEVYQTNHLENELRAMREDYAKATTQVRNLEEQIIALKAQPQIHPSRFVERVGKNDIRREGGRVSRSSWNHAESACRLAQERDQYGRLQCWR